MKPSRATLEILGDPGQGVSVFSETPLDASPPPIFEGEIPLGGQLRLRVPRSPLVLVVTGFGNASVRFEDGRGFQRVDTRPVHRDGDDVGIPDPSS